MALFCNVNRNKLFPNGWGVIKERKKYHFSVLNMGERVEISKGGGWYSHGNGFEGKI